MTIVPIPGSREDWLRLRTRYVGASETAALWDAQADYASSRFALWLHKAGHIAAPNVDVERARWGTLMEPVVAHEIARMEEWGIEWGGFATDDTTLGMSATLDYQITSHTETAPGHVGRGVLEIKCVDWLVYKRVWGGSPPLYVELQLQHQLACTGYQWGAIGALVSGNESHVWRRRARPKMIDEIRVRVSNFWKSISAGQKPNIDDRDTTTEALRTLYRVEADTEADIPPDLIAPVQEACQVMLIEAASRLSGLRRETAVKNLLLAAMGSADTAYIPAPDLNSPAYRIKRSANGRLKVIEMDPSR